MRMEEWAAFHDDLRIFRLLEGSTEPQAAAVEVPPVHVEPAPSRNYLTGYLGGELIEAIHLQAASLGIEIDRLSVDVEVGSLDGTGASNGFPCLRYAINLRTEASAGQLTQLHDQVRSTCVYRLEAEYDLHIVGELILVRVTQSVEEPDR